MPETMSHEAGRETDALVAEKVMGWVRMTEGELYGDRFNEVYPGAANAGFDETRLCSYWYDPKTLDKHGQPCSTHHVDTVLEYDYSYIGFHPSTDISVAWLVVEKMPSDWWPEIGRMDDGTWYCEIVGRGDTPADVSDGPLARELADTAPLAICRAALACMEGD